MFKNNFNDSDNSISKNDNSGSISNSDISDFISSNDTTTNAISNEGNLIVIQKQNGVQVLGDRLNLFFENAKVVDLEKILDSDLKINNSIANKFLKLYL